MRKKMTMMVAVVALMVAMLAPAAFALEIDIVTEDNHEHHEQGRASLFIARCLPPEVLPPWPLPELHTRSGPSRAASSRKSCLAYALPAHLEGPGFVGRGRLASRPLSPTQNTSGALIRQTSPNHLG